MNYIVEYSLKDRDWVFFPGGEYPNWNMAFDIALTIWEKKQAPLAVVRVLNGRNQIVENWYAND